VDPERITVSSDGGGCLPLFDADGRITQMDIGQPLAMTAVLAELLRDGHALETVLPAFTSNVARLLRLPAKGQIQPGGDADLVVLAADHTVDSVMAAGSWHRRDGDQLIKGSFEE